jgi:hypothetical protein
MVEEPVGYCDRDYCDRYAGSGEDTSVGWPVAS